MFSTDLFKHLRCAEIEHRDGVEMHHFEFEHVSYDGDEDGMSDHVIWLPVFILSSKEEAGCVKYGCSTLTTLGDLIQPFLPYTILWDVPAGMTLHEYLKLLSVPPISVEH
jgi:hypothetical protein